VHRAIRSKWNFQPGEGPPDSEEEEEESAKEDVDGEIEDVAPPAAVKLDDIVPEDYDEEAAIVSDMELSKAEEVAGTGGHRPALSNGGGACRQFATATTSAAARATAGCVGRTDCAATTVERATAADAVVRAATAATIGAFLGAAAVGAAALCQPRLRQRRRHRQLNLVLDFTFQLCKLYSN
jgi:hypothetical protein